MSQSKENLVKRPVALIAALSLALGASACNNPFTDKNDLKICPTAWGSTDIEVGNTASGTMAQATANLEAARTTLIANIDDSFFYSGRSVGVDSIPGKYRAAAELLFERDFDVYNINGAKLDTPREQFCLDEASGSTYESPEYVMAEATLKSSGINPWGLGNG